LERLSTKFNMLAKDQFVEKVL
jgi:dynein heavy chain 1